MEGRELPVGWSEATIQDISVKVGSGATPKGGEAAYKASGIPLIRSTNVVFFGFKQTGLAFIDSKQAEALNNATVKRGDVLLNITGASIGRVTTAPEWADGARVNQHVCIIRPSEGVNANYLGAYLSSPEFQLYVWSDNYGVTRQALTKQQILEVSLPLPPQAEQRRIAAKLDTTLAAVEACRQRLDGVAAILKRFRQAVLAAATSGELTREWREERGIGDHLFQSHKLGDLLKEPLRNGKSVRDGNGHLVLRLSCLRNGSIDWTESKRGDWGDTSAERYFVNKGDFLVARGNGSKDLVGRGCLVNEEPPRIAFPDTMIRIRPDPRKIDPRYLAIAWDQQLIRDQIEGTARTSAGIWKVAQGDLESIQIFTPLIYEEQQEIIRRTQELFSLADKLEARLTTARKIVERLTPALLAKAFRGELVPQDPGDEPASALLERFRAARQAEAAASGPSRRGRRQAAANPDPIALEAAPVPADFLTALLRECGALSKRALLAVSELEPQQFQQQLQMELESGTACEVQGDGQVLLEAVG